MWEQNCLVFDLRRKKIIFHHYVVGYSHWLKSNNEHQSQWHSLEMAVLHSRKVVTYYMYAWRGGPTQWSPEVSTLQVKCASPHCWTFHCISIMQDSPFMGVSPAPLSHGDNLALEPLPFWESVMVFAESAMPVLVISPSLGTVPSLV